MSVLKKIFIHYQIKWYTYNKLTLNHKSLEIVLEIKRVKGQIEKIKYEKETIKKTNSFAPKYTIIHILLHINLPNFSILEFSV